eukprot:CAMPEP_0174374024 /NCGR_PEP_ID=MMETSP0811_2-20130205/109378_1 /TAXON_ID=73025 ORGANISM="Eutreptiella gymnastica-like, Strain CCMP1594" /NCGR_SAMPLE_ID=MMETSP0811_2 /ASSEMBLY_ACC=CAM_ASM_000667 /LENGTH=70 /DNA_ID=CAMNT_0015522971 /DNA_START=250 /DNA_END=462 /DNA_ORIENTATION=+
MTQQCMYFDTLDSCARKQRMQELWKKMCMDLENSVHVYALSASPLGRTAHYIGLSITVVALPDTSNGCSN